MCNKMHEKWVFNWTVIGRAERPRRLDHGGSQGLYGAGCPGSRTASTFSVALSTSETSMSSPLPSFIDFSARTHRQCQATVALPNARLRLWSGWLSPFSSSLAASASASLSCSSIRI